MIPATIQPASLVEHALAYAHQGYEVFPCHPHDAIDDQGRPLGAKAPLTTHGMQDATSDPATVARWWTRHPDALIGCRIPGDAIVLDIDPRHGGDKTWKALQDHYGPITPGMMHLSGRGDGGAHAWFKRPPGKLSVKLLNDFARQNNTGHATGKQSWTSGIDILHHGHRYTILPPSPHPDTGLPYKWATQGDLAAMPAFLAYYVVAPIAPPSPLPGPRVADSDSIADWYSQHATWNDILGNAGWLLVSGDGNTDGSAWRHPNATAAQSCTIRHGCLFVYSPNTDFDVTEDGNPVGYTRFKAWATLEHGGDMQAAARVAREARDGAVVRQNVTIGAPMAPQAPQPATGDNDTQDEPESDWARIDLVGIAREIADGVRQRELPSVLEVEGGIPLFYRGRVNQVFGASGDGKTWAALAACAEGIRRGELVMLVDWEDNPDGAAARMLALGLTPDDLALFDYRNPSSGIGSTMAFEGLAGCTEHPYTVIVIDSTGEAMASGGVDGNVDGEVAAWFRHAKAMSRWPSLPAVILIDHVPKATDAPAGAIGSQRKTAAITGAAYFAQQVQAFARGKSGKIKMTVQKDRLGHRAKRSVACEIHVTSVGDDGVVINCRMSEAEAAKADGKPFRPTTLMEKVSRFIEANPGMPKSVIEKAVEGKAASVRQAVECLVLDGYVMVDVGPKNAIEHRAVTPYRAPVGESEVCSSLLVPARPSGQGTSTKHDGFCSSPVPSLSRDGDEQTEVGKKDELDSSARPSKRDEQTPPEVEAEEAPALMPWEDIL